MKVEVEIPDGEYCGMYEKACVFLCSTGRIHGESCRLLKANLRPSQSDDTWKHPDCPSLKEEK